MQTRPFDETPGDGEADSRLVALIRKGRQLAFQRLYDFYWERLFAYAYNRLYDREASEEVVQDVFLSLWAKRESLQITTSLSAYLYGATRHRLLNEIRSEKLRKRYASEFAAFAKDAFDNSNAEFQDLKDLEGSIAMKIAELPTQCQTVFRLSREEHIPNKHIAASLKISTKTVENYLTRALKHLRTSLGQFL